MQVAAATSQFPLLCTEVREGLSLLVPELTDVERGGEVIRSLLQERALPLRVRPTVEARTKPRFAIPTTVGDEWYGQSGRGLGHAAAQRGHGGAPRGRDHSLPKAEVPREALDGGLNRDLGRLIGERVDPKRPPQPPFRGFTRGACGREEVLQLFANGID